MSKQILIVDDDVMLCRLSSIYLERRGHTTILAYDGPGGISHYQASQPDLVVLDVAMPGMSGFDVARRIRNIEHEQGWKRAPIILLTAYARSFFMAAGSEAGIDSYLTKPITPDQLLKHLERFLEDKPED
ncbi:MAG TPA: response regulator [Aggregatilineaceae bacterium]|nr:response regulator [Aggregatilineaceae bacterium]